MIVSSYFNNNIFKAFYLSAYFSYNLLIVSLILYV